MLPRDLVEARIVVLPPALASQIAAGQVVERSPVQPGSWTCGSATGRELGHTLHGISSDCRAIEARVVPLKGARIPVVISALGEDAG